jgi:hypothetical protein
MLLLELPRMRGNSRTRTRRSEGMHAQMMPTLTSMVDQFAMSHWSQVGFVDFAK